MKNRSVLALCLAIPLFGASEGPYRVALPGFHYEFPRDHFNHPEFQTEWWYYTGNLHTPQGRRFGFELTFFRQGVDRETSSTGVWDVHDIWMAHLALSDFDGGRFLHTERLNRSGAGIAGADFAQANIWNGNWQVHFELDPQAPGAVASQQLQAVAGQFSFQLSLRSKKLPVIHGEHGVSQKSERRGRASHYVSFTRLFTNGTLTLEGKQFVVDGLSWMDHEFFTNQLDTNQTGWDWFSLQFDDGSDLMLFQLRRNDGTIDPYSAGTYVDSMGRTTHLAAASFSLIPGQTWTSPDTGGRYPVEWMVRVPSLGLQASLRTRLVQQELTGRTPAVPTYWEGAVESSGTKNNKPVKGAGYVEMVGYSGRAPIGN
jgi:predicted secreted hydrolase